MANHTGLDALNSMAALRELDLTRTTVTDDAAAKLTAALPRRKIWWADDQLIQPKPGSPHRDLPRRRPPGYRVCPVRV